MEGIKLHKRAEGSGELTMLNTRLMKMSEKDYTPSGISYARSPILLETTCSLNFRMDGASKGLFSFPSGVNL